MRYVCAPQIHCWELGGKKTIQTDLLAVGDGGLVQLYRILDAELTRSQEAQTSVVITANLAFELNKSLMRVTNNPCQRNEP